MKKYTTTILVLVILPVCGIFAFNYWSENTYSGLMYSAIKQKNNPLTPIVLWGDLEPNLPKDDENNKSISGIDSNANGIRDDVEIWINRNSGDLNTALALRNFTKALQIYIINCAQLSTMDKDKINTLEIHLNKLNWKRKDNPNYFSDKIKILVLNNSKRKECFKL